MSQLSLGQLHRLSGKAISALPAAISIVHEGRTVALLTPARLLSPEYLAAFEGDEAEAGQESPAD